MQEGIVLGVLTWGSMILSWKHVPDIIKKILCKNYFWLDCTAAILSFLMITSITKSLAGVLGAVITGMLVNVTVRFFPP